jgi:hypothetical protein
MLTGVRIFGILGPIQAPAMMWRSKIRIGLNWPNADA